MKRTDWLRARPAILVSNSGADGNASVSCRTGRGWSLACLPQPTTSTLERAAMSATASSAGWDNLVSIADASKCAL